MADRPHARESRESRPPRCHAPLEPAWPAARRIRIATDKAPNTNTHRNEERPTVRAGRDCCRLRAPRRRQWAPHQLAIMQSCSNALSGLGRCAQKNSTARASLAGGRCPRGLLAFHGLSNQLRPMRISMDAWTKTLSSRESRVVAQSVHLASVMRRLLRETSGSRTANGRAQSTAGAP